MPENVRIAAFVFGAILVLIAILGGNFKLFGAEVAVTVSNRFLRFVAFALGTALLISAILSPGLFVQNPPSIKRPSASPSSLEKNPSRPSKHQDSSSFPINPSECTTWKYSTSIPKLPSGQIKVLSEFTFFPDETVKHRFYASGSLALEGTGTAQFSEDNRGTVAVTGSARIIMTGEVSKLDHTFKAFSRDGKTYLIDQYGGIYTKSNDSSC